MSFNKVLCCITNKHSRLSLSRILNNVFLCRSLSSDLKYPTAATQNISKEALLKQYNKLIEKDLTCFKEPSATNEQQNKFKNSVITVPSLHFEDLTFEPPVTHTDLCDVLQICDSIDEQMMALTSTLALSPDDIQSRVRFMKEIESLLRPFFGEMKIQMFGSSVNGFGFKGCDIDMSFETPGEDDKVSYLENPDVPFVSEVMSGKVSPAEIVLLPRKEQLLFIHSVLIEFYKESELPVIFIKAIIPLVRFHHDKYGLKCDLTCRNRVAYANTKLLYLLGKLDHRVIPLIMTIRYWAKYVELIGKGLLFNTYTITLLVIHFLQTRNPPVLPIIKDILTLSDNLEIEDMNDESFLEIRSHIPPSENNQTLSELLRDFFFYYTYFDFTRVICPLIGGSVPRDEFFSNETSKKFRMNSICVQDPMLATHNVAEFVDYRTCKKFFTELMLACRLFQNSSDLTPSENKWGISILLDKPDEYLPSNNKWQRSISFPVPLITRQMFSACKSSDKNDLTAETLLFFLEHVLLFECEVLEMSEVIDMLKIHDKEIGKLKKVVEIKNQFTSELGEVYKNSKKKPKILHHINTQKFDNALMVENFREFSSKNKLLLCVKCKASKNSWLGRDQVSLESLSVVDSSDLFETERYVSLQAAKQNELNITDKKEKGKPLEFFFECYESPELSESAVVVNLRPFQKPSFNPVLGIFLKEYLPKMMENLNDGRTSDSAFG